MAVSTGHSAPCHVWFPDLLPPSCTHSTTASSTSSLAARASRSCRYQSRQLYRLFDRHGPTAYIRHKFGAEWQVPKAAAALQAALPNLKRAMRIDGPIGSDVLQEAVVSELAAVLGARPFSLYARAYAHVCTHAQTHAHRTQARGAR